MKNPAVTTTFQTRTREAIEAFVELIERRKAELINHPHPGPLPRERENSIQRQVNPGAVASLTDLQDTRNARPLSPLPGGEGQGEGGRHTNFAGALQSWADSFLDEVGYFAELRRSEKEAEAGENRIRNLKDFIATMDATGSSTTSLHDRLQSFLEDVTLDTEREEEEENTGDAVTLITMHSCKGLEFPHVYIVGLEDGLLPHSRSKVEGTLDEERRLFYVAVTRAMLTLTISHCGGRKKFGQVLPCHPSPFLNELPAELVETDDEKSKKPVEVNTGKSLFAVMRDAAH
jgi:superfamily I DNA/RNA helicase